ncbi:MAG TPA: hypothetical protein VF234_03440 [Limnochordia bacterium]
MSLYRWILFLHVLSALTFALAHGVAVVMAFRLRREHALEPIRTLLEASAATLPAMHASLYGIIGTGIILGWWGSWWRSAWVWVSLVLLLLITAWMGRHSGRFYQRLRRAAGLPHGGPHPAQQVTEAPDPQELLRLARATAPVRLLIGGYGGLVVILWLMMFKPF